MAAPGKKIFPLGLEAGIIYALNSDGVPAATSTTVYDGIEIGGPTVFTMDSVAREQVAHPGNNGVLQYDSLPGISAPAGSLTGSRIDLDTAAAVTGTKVFVESETNWIGRDTDTEQKSLPSFAMVLYTQAKGKALNVRTYNTLVFPQVTLAPQNRSLQRERSDPSNYQITFSKTTQDITGRAWTLADDGALVKTYNEGESFYRIHYAFFKSDGTGPAYLFSANRQAANMSVYVITVGVGVERTTNVTKAVTGVTFTVSQPAVDTIICVKYYLAANAIDIN